MVPHASKPAMGLKNTRRFLKGLRTITHVKRASKSDHVKRLRGLTCRFTRALAPVDIGEISGTLDAIDAHCIVGLNRHDLQAAGSEHQGQMRHTGTDITNFVRLFRAGNRQHRINGRISIVRALQVRIRERSVVPFCFRKFLSFNRLQRSLPAQPLICLAQNYDPTAASGSSISKSKPATWVNAGIELAIL